MPSFNEKVEVLNGTGTIDRISLNPIGPYIRIRDEVDKESILLNGATRSVYFKSTAGMDSITLNGAKGDVYIFDEDGKRAIALQTKAYFDNKTTGLWIGAAPGDSGPKAGHVVIRNSDGKDVILLDG